MNALSLTLLAAGAAPVGYNPASPYTDPSVGWAAPSYLPAQYLPGSAPPQMMPPGAPPQMMAPGMQPQMMAPSAPYGMPAYGVPSAAPAGQYVAPPAEAPGMSELITKSSRGLFQSDHEFDGFIDSVTNSVLSKDPRSSTYLRFLFINNNIPAGHPIGGGNIQVYGLQTNVALTERLAFVADKDGGARIAPRNGPSTSGYLNVAAGLKYTFIRDVETQTLAAIGFMYEIPNGEAKVQQNQGSGSIIPFLTVGKEFNQFWHVVHTIGHFTPLRAADGSGFLYNSLHIDRQVFGWLYPLAEFNWFWYTSGGNRLPTAFGEGDGLINFGTRGQAGAHLVTGAVGAKAVVSRNLAIGAAFEFPLTNRHDIINQRFTLQVTARY
jgi:hypothetical protein